MPTSAAGNKPCDRAVRGFTLIELMVVVALMALALALAWALAALCQAQVDRAESRRLLFRVQDMVFGHCLDQMGNLTIARCRERFAAEH